MQIAGSKVAGTVADGIAAVGTEVAEHSFGASEAGLRTVGSQQAVEEQERSFFEVAATVGGCCRPVGGCNVVAGREGMENAMVAAMVAEEQARRTMCAGSGEVIRGEEFVGRLIIAEGVPSDESR
jgi:hypothetical protein